ncbi:MAG: aminotransferase class III-fold pyridoxal phosphate-dependent enzyme [Pseudomonadales bacterium]
MTAPERHLPVTDSDYPARSMEPTTWAGLAGAAVALPLLRKLQIRLRLSRAKHASVTGHARISRRLARLIPHYEYDTDTAFSADGVSREIAERRRQAFERLGNQLAAAAPESLRLTEALEPHVADLQFTNAYRVPFQFRSLVRNTLRTGAMAVASDGVRIQNPDGNWSYDVGGSYGVNLLGYDFYKGCIERAVARVGKLGPVLGPYHPVIAENVQLLCRISGLDQVSFHMSGTEAVMQAVGLARYHTGRSQVVQFCGAYHGWWDGVQPGVGGQRSARDVYLLEEMSARTLKVLRTRRDIACVLINPLQALHPNRGASNDAMLIASDRSAAPDPDAYGVWLRELREVCTSRGIVLLFDEVFVGFRLGLGGAQERFGVQADMVTYGKTLGGGLPVGVLCGRADLMKRYREDRPTDICYARGTFNSHPYVMATMNEFLRDAVSDEFGEQIARAESDWNRRAASLNRCFETAELPLKVHNLSSIWLLTYEQPGRFNWMYQYYLRSEGLALSWVGTGRFIFSHNYTDADFAEVQARFVRAALRMKADGWWERPEDLTNAAIRKQVLREVLSRRLSPG